MIEAQKLNKEKIFINPDLILWIESVPDTVVTFSNGQKLNLLTKPDEIIKKIIEFKRQMGIEVKIKTKEG